MALTETFSNLADRFIRLAEWLTPGVNALLQLGARVYLALVFWKSGLTKTGHFDFDRLTFENWQSTLFLFEHEYKVPLLPVGLAAFGGTLVELTVPLLVFIGLATRFAAVPLIFMTAVIQFTYLSSITHLYWFAACLYLLANGAGRYSWDHIIRKKFWNDIGRDEGMLTSGLSNFVVWVLTLLAIYEIPVSLFDTGFTPLLEQVTNLVKS